MMRLQVHVGDWEAAVRAAGSLLVDSGAATPAYVEAMVAAVQAMGPYMVLAPGVALAHARPGPAVRSVGISLVNLATPVPFGHGANDPVRLVVAFCAVDSGSHLGMLAELSAVLDQPAALAALQAATDPAQVLAYL